MKRFEYKIKKLRWLSTDELDDINKLGIDGWEMVSLIYVKEDGYPDSYYRVIFKREITEL